jgi:regulator of sigma E protease
LAAGVTFNVISAIIVYIVVFSVGINLAGPIIGDVMPGSSAERAGVRPGDEVIEVAGDKGRLDFSDVIMASVLSGKGESVPLTIRHEDGTIEDVSLVAEQLPGMPYRSFGIERPLGLTIAKVTPKDVNFLRESTGLMPGDRIKAVEGIDVNSNWRYEQIVKGTFEPNATLLAERKDSSGQTQLVEGHINLVFPATTGQKDDSDLSSVALAKSEANLANICGMVPRMRIVPVSSSFKDWLHRSKDKEARLKDGDIIAAVGDIENPTYSEMRQLINEYEGRKLPVAVIRSDANGVQQRLTVEVVPKKEKDTNRVVIGIFPELDVERAVVAKTIATPQQPEAPAIPRGATITAVDGVAVSSFYDVARQLRKNAGQHVTIDWRLDRQKAGDTAIAVGKQEQIAMVQSLPRQIVPFEQLERLYKADGPIDAIKMGYKRTKIFIIQSYVTLQRLIGGLVSPKELMGPVGILTFSYRIVAAQPFIYYLYFLGLISASIAVLNFLPLPPLDGGLTVLLLVEKIKGSAISIRTQELIAYAGWGLVGALLLYVTFNDFARLIFG